MQGTWTITIGGVTYVTPSTALVNPTGRDGGPTIAEYAAYGSGQPIWIDLGNSKTQTKFDITQTFSTDTLAYAYYMSAQETWAGVATVVMTHTDYEAANTSWTVTNAKVELSVATPIGKTTITKLTITGPLTV